MQGVQGRKFFAGAHNPQQNLHDVFARRRSLGRCLQDFQTCFK
jgi:hypothetical protein